MLSLGWCVHAKSIRSPKAIFAAAFDSGLFLEPVSTATSNASLSRIVAVFGSPLAPCQTTTNKEKELTQTKIGHTHARKDIGCVDCDCVVVVIVIVVGCRCVTFVFWGDQIHGNGNQIGKREWCGSEVREEKGRTSVSFYCSRADVAKLRRFPRSHIYVCKNCIAAPEKKSADRKESQK